VALAVASLGQPTGARADQSALARTLALESAVSDVRARQNQAMTLRAAPQRGGSEPLSFWNVGFAYLKSTAEVTTPELYPLFAFSGKDSQARTRMIDLSDVESFRILCLDTAVFGNTFAIVEITRFPALSISQLVQQRPSRAMLEAQHKEIVRLTIPLQTARGELYVVGRAQGSPGYQVAARLADFQTQTLLRFERTGDPWWYASVQ
jgi:hypothetical protein